MNNIQEYSEEKAKPIVRIGDFGLVRYQKKEPDRTINPEILERIENEVRRNNEFKLPFDLFGNPIVEKARKKYVRKGPGERKSILKEIKDIMDEEARKQKKAPVNTKLFAIRLSHVPTNDLYFMKSEGLSYGYRTGKPFSKYIMGSVKPKKE